MRVNIVDGPLPRSPAGAPPTPAPPNPDPADPAGVGAAVVFEGIVRGMESGREIAALDYEAYEPMASRQLELLARDVLEKHGLKAVWVEHSRGRVGVGEVSFRLTVHAAHRKEALAGMDEFIDRMKKDVPIWKRAGD